MDSGVKLMSQLSCRCWCLLWCGSRWFGGAVARGSQWQSGWIWVVQTPDGKQDRPEVCRWSNILSVVSDLKGDSFKPGKLLILHSDSRRWENSNVENAQQEKGGNNGMETWSELNEMEYIHMYIHLHMCVSFKWKKKKTIWGKLLFSLCYQFDFNLE